MLRPRGQTDLEAKIFGLGLDMLASTSWPRPQAFGLGLASVLFTWPRKCAIQCKIILVVSISWLYHCNIHYKDVVKHSDVGHKFIYVFLAVSPCVPIQKYLPVAGLGLGLGLEDLDSALALSKRFELITHWISSFLRPRH